MDKRFFSTNDTLGFSRGRHDFTQRALRGSGHNGIFMIRWFFAPLRSLRETSRVLCVKPAAFFVLNLFIE